MAQSDVVSHCLSRGWPVKAQSSGKILVTVPAGEVGCDLQCTVLIGPAYVTWCTWLPLSVPEGRWLRVLRLVADLNWELFVGNFEIDPSYRFLGFRTYTAVVDGHISEEAFEALADENLARVDDLFIQVALAAGQPAA